MSLEQQIFDYSTAKIDSLSNALQNGSNLAIEQFQTLAPQAWTILVRQQLLEGVCSLLALIFCSILGIYLIKKWYNDDYNEDILPFKIFGSVFTGIGFIFSLAYFFSEGLSKLLNPEYWAAIELINQMKGF